MKDSGLVIYPLNLSVRGEEHKNNPQGQAAFLTPGHAAQGLILLDPSFRKGGTPIVLPTPLDNSLTSQNLLGRPY